MWEEGRVWGRGRAERGAEGPWGELGSGRKGEDGERGGRAGMRGGGGGGGNGARVWRRGRGEGGARGPQGAESGVLGAHRRRGAEGRAQQPEVAGARESPAATGMGRRSAGGRGRGTSSAAWGAPIPVCGV